DSRRNASIGRSRRSGPKVSRDSCRPWRTGSYGVRVDTLVAGRKEKTRLDMLLVERGLAASRDRAQALILAGGVRVDGQVVSKAGASVPANADIALAAPDHPYVSRGGLKLAHALDAFRIDVTGRTALDIGASTG